MRNLKRALAAVFVLLLAAVVLFFVLENQQAVSLVLFGWAAPAMPCECWSEAFWAEASWAEAAPPVRATTIQAEQAAIRRMRVMDREGPD